MTFVYSMLFIDSAFPPVVWQRQAEAQGRNSSMRRTGTVKWFNETKGYGFIEQRGDKDVFVHYSAIRMDGYRTLREGQSVVYTVRETPKGLQAAEVVCTQ